VYQQPTLCKLIRDSIMLSYLSVGKRKSKVTSIRFRYISTFNLIILD